MKLKDLIDNIMNKLNFNELEIRENNAVFYHVSVVV